MKAQYNFKKLKKSANKIKRILRKFKDKKFMMDNVLSFGAGHYANSVIEKIETGSFIPKKVDPLALFLYNYYNVDPRGSPPLRVTDNLIKNIMIKFNINNLTTKIGFFKDELKIDYSEWYERGNKNPYQASRSAQDGLMIAALTLEKGSKRIHVPMRARLQFGILVDYFTIPPRQYLYGRFGSFNRQLALRKMIEGLKKAVRNISH
jgi:hypothetical protein